MKFWVASLGGCVLCSGILLGQGVSSRLPDCPSATQSTSANSSLYYEAKRRKPALSDREKFQVFVEEAQSPLTFFSAGVAVGSDSFQRRAYASRSLSFQRRYTAALAGRETNAFLGRYLFPTVLSQDPRYHPSESDRTVSRAGYALTRVFVTRNDEGKPVVNTSYLLGALLSSVVSNNMVNSDDPLKPRRVSDTFGDFGSTVGGDAGLNLLREFWPQLKAKVLPVASKAFLKNGQKLSSPSSPTAGAASDPEGN